MVENNTSKYNNLLVEATQKTDLGTVKKFKNGPTVLFFNPVTGKPSYKQPELKINYEEKQILEDMLKNRLTKEQRLDIRKKIIDDPTMDPFDLYNMDIEEEDLYE